MRVLMVCHMRWRRDLGGPRVQLELGEALQEQGHDVDKYSWEDAFAHRQPTRLVRDALLTFAMKAQRHVRTFANRYDVVDVHLGDIVVSKRSLAFDGTLIVRSSGLTHFYNSWERADKRASPPATVRSTVNWQRRRPLLALNAWATERSLDAADWVFVNNGAERRFLAQRSGWKSKVVQMPLGLARETLEALAQRPVPQFGVGKPRTICVLGHWSTRKGNRYVPRVILEVCRRYPGTRFLLAGTAVPESKIRADIGAADGPNVSIVPWFDPKDLAHVLSEVDIGIFPSAVEGFGLAVIEQLASGIPVVAYDIPGPADILAALGGDLLVPPGDVGALIDKVCALLDASESDFQRLTAECRAYSRQYAWDAIVPTVLRHYATR